MAKELWAHCEECEKDFLVPFDKNTKNKIDPLLAGKSVGEIGLECPAGHRMIVDSADKSKVFVRGK